MRQQRSEGGRGLCLSRPQGMGTIKQGLSPSVFQQEAEEEEDVETGPFPGFLAISQLGLKLRPQRLACASAGDLGAPFLWAAAPSSRCDGEMAPEPLGPSCSPSEQAPIMLIAEVAINKQVPVLEPFTVHLGRQSRVLEMYARA